MLSAPARTRVSGLDWIDRLKGVAMVWVVLNHLTEQLAGGNLAADPTGSWPPLSDRIAQWQTGVTGFGPFSWPLTGARDLGWLADQAVSIFIILSGFGLALGLIASHAGPKLDAPDFFGRRLRRIYPLWWGAHVLFLPTGYLLASGLSTGDWRFYASFAGLRCIPDVFGYFAGSWWYVGVIIQLYLAFPVLWWVLRARGVRTLLALTWALGFASLALGHAFFRGDLVEMWQRGICAVTRLPEFGFGMAFALWWTRGPERGASFLRNPAVRIGAAVAYAAGFALSFTLAGMVVAPTILGIAAIVLSYPLMAWRATGRGALELIGRHSFTIYLTHQYIVEVLVRPGRPALATCASIVSALLVTAAATYVLERGTASVEDLWKRLARSRGRTFAGLAFGTAVLALIGLPVGAEVALDAAPSAQPGGEGDLGSQAGAPQLALAAGAKAGLRVLVLGDAVSSAGVDTAAWPQLLESDLRMYRSAEVANFAEDGDGPNQEAPVVHAFAPLYRPDVVLVQVDPDDVRDVLTVTATLSDPLGTGRPARDDVRSLFQLERLRARLSNAFRRSLGKLVERPASYEGYSLGEFVFLERGHPEWDGNAVLKSAERYRDIARAARAVGARTVLVFVPAPAQVCGPATLAYYPPHVALADRSRYDIDLPDRRARDMAAAAQLTLWDFSADLRARFSCPYAPHDLRLRPEAQSALAALVARRLLPDAPVLGARPGGMRALQAPEGNAGD
jgi:peptidoglycan/LPS O-acetylase OafA/YrhL